MRDKFIQSLKDLGIRLIFINDNEVRVYGGENEFFLLTENEINKLLNENQDN
jgi:hypothetical protein